MGLFSRFLLELDPGPLMMTEGMQGSFKDSMRVAIRFSIWV